MRSPCDADLARAMRTEAAAAYLPSQASGRAARVTLPRGRSGGSGRPPHRARPCASGDDGEREASEHKGDSCRRGAWRSWAGSLARIGACSLTAWVGGNCLRYAYVIATDSLDRGGAAGREPAGKRAGQRTSGLSIIIPTLNESKCIATTLDHLCLLNPKPLEVIVVDGGSVDGTASIARGRNGAKVVVSTSKGRAVQMNRGAREAKGEHLMFLHADTLPPLDTCDIVRCTLGQGKASTVLGGFVPRIQEQNKVYWFMSMHDTVSSFYPILLRPLTFFRGGLLLFGDQAMFCRRRDFEHAGGFDETYPIMEDAGLCIRMHEAGACDLAAEGKQCWWSPLPWGRRRRGRIVLVPRVVETSGRRISSTGSQAKLTFVHFLLGLSWYIGAPPDQLASMFRKWYPDSAR